MISYITRINLGAVVTDIVAQTGIEKSSISMAVTGSAITYGIGQLLSGYIGDRVSPKKLIFGGLLVSSAMNIMLPLCSNHIQMTAFWCVNGMAQAFMWPPMVKMMTGLFSETEYRRASTMVNWGASFGTIAIYLLSPAVIALWGWRTLFFITASMGILMAACWQKFSKEPVYESKTLSEKQQKRYMKKNTGEKKQETGVWLLLAAIMFGIVLQGALRDGVTTWMPSYIFETYHLSSEISIFTGIFLPIFGIICLRIALALYEKMPDNPVRCACIFFGIGAAAALVLRFVSGSSILGSVLCASLLTGCMQGVNLMLICMVPAFFHKHGNISTISGMLNSCTYVGSAFSTYGIARLAENSGWQTTIFSWFVIAALGTVVCLLCARGWNKKRETF